MSDDTKNPADSQADSRPRSMQDMAQFHHDGDRPEMGRQPGPLEDMFWENDGRPVHKWHHYLPLYDRYLAPYRGKPIRMLEIGVLMGGSLTLWRRFLGPEAIIYGIDINPECANFDGQAAQVRIGSQDDPDFLASVVREMGGVDIVLDDGSHDNLHIRASFQTLFPLLSDCGLYIIEDLHSAYWTDFSGGYAVPSSFMNDINTMIDDMHHWYHDEGQRISAAAGHLAGLHIHDSMVVLEKQTVQPPRHTVRANRARELAREKSARARDGSSQISPEILLAKLR